MNKILIGGLITLTMATSALAQVITPVMAQKIEKLPENSSLEETNPSSEQIKDYILNNPEVIIQSLQNYEQKLRAQEEKKFEQTIRSQHDNIFAKDKFSVILGNKDSDLKMAYFHDYRCGFCKRSWPNIQKLIQNNPDLGIYVKDIPILGEASMLATQYAFAAALQGKQEALTDAYIAHKSSWSEKKLQDIAKSLNIDVEKLIADSQNIQVKEAIKKNMTVANTLEIQGTPVFVIGDTLIEGAVALEDLQNAIDDAKENL